MSDSLTFSNVGPRVPSVTVAYSEMRVNKESNPIFEEIDSYPEGGTYIPDAIPRAGGGAYPVDFIEARKKEGPKVVESSIRDEFAASSIISSLTMRTLVNQLEKYRIPSSCTPTVSGEHCQVNDP